MAFQGAEEFVAEKRVAVGNQGVPLGGGNIGQGVEAFNAHDARVSRIWLKLDALFWNSKQGIGSPFTWACLNGTMPAH